MFYRLAHEGKDKKAFNSFGRPQTNEQKQLFLVRGIIFSKLHVGLSHHQPYDILKSIRSINDNTFSMQRLNERTYRKRWFVLNSKTNET